MTYQQLRKAPVDKLSALLAKADAKTSAANYMVRVNAAKLAADIRSELERRALTDQ